MLLFNMCWDPECHLVMSEFALSSERTYFSLPIHRKRHLYNDIAPSDVAKADALDSGRFLGKGRTNYALVGHTIHRSLGYVPSFICRASAQ